MVRKKVVAKKVFALGFVYLCLALMFAPIFVLIVFSFTDSTAIGIWNGFTFNVYAKLFQNKELMLALINTMMLAVSSAVIATILGTLGAIGVYYSKPRIKKVYEAVTQIPVVNAEIVMALSLVVLFVSLGIGFNFFTLLVGHVALSVAFVYLSVKPRLVGMDPSIYEAALDLGATPSYALHRILIPEILPGIVSGFMLAFTLSLDDYVVTAFLRGARLFTLDPDNNLRTFNTLSTYVQSTIAKNPLPPELRALTTLIFIFAFGFLFINNMRINREAKLNQFHHRGGNKNEK